MIVSGIPTMYRGIRFRSRNEARWAAFLDTLGWHWVYEPFDLSGYIPDFVIRFDAGDLLLEVKPSTTLAELYELRAKLEQSGWCGEALIVGSALFDARDADVVIGLFGERESTPDGLGWAWSKARVFGCLSCGQPSVLAEDGSWRCRVCGADDGHIGLFSGAQQAFADACNRVQWRVGA